MRDSKRIDPIMKKLTALWKLHPDWRLCQLLFNVAISTGWKQDDLFFFEDDELLKALGRLEERSKQHD